MFWRGVLGYLPVNLVQGVAGFGSILVFTRLLSPEAYGDYAIAFAVSSLAHTLLLTWLEAAMARFWAAEREGADRDALFATLYRTFAVIGLGGPALAAVVMAFAPLHGGLRLAIVAGLAGSAARALLRIGQERRRAAGDVAGFAGIDMLATGGGFVLGGLLAWRGLGAAAPFAGVALASAACLVVALPSELPAARRGRFDPARLRRYLAYGIPLSLSLAMSLALASTDRFVLAAFTGEAAVGAYHAGYTLSNRTLDVLFVWIGMAAGPAAVIALERGGEAALRKAARHQAAILVLVTLPAAVGLALVARPLAQVMVGPALAAQAARVTPWIAFGAFFSGVTTYYFHTAFTLARRTVRQFAAVAIPAAANLALCLALVPRFGLDGAMWATTASYGLGLLASIVLGRGALALPIPWSALASAAVGSAGMALAIAALPAVGAAAPELLLEAGVGAAIYAAVVFALNPEGLRDEALALLRGRMSPRATRPEEPA